MSDTSVTMNTIQGLPGAAFVEMDGMQHIAVAHNTVVLKDSGILLLDHDGFMKVLKRETFGMMVSVFGLGQILFQKAVREVAVDAGGDMMMTRFLPGVVLSLHNVAIGAGLRIGA
jgi:hypothetical protein